MTLHYITLHYITKRQTDKHIDIMHSALCEECSKWNWSMFIFTPQNWAPLYWAIIS